MALPEPELDKRRCHHASLIDIGKKCRASKAKIYHYFKSKHEILFLLLQEYCLSVIEMFENADENAPPQERLRLFLESFIQRPSRMKDRHTALLNDLKYLPARAKSQIVALERRLVRHMVTLLKQVKRGKDIDERVLHTYVLLMFGTINGIDLWYNPNGLMSSEELSKRLCRLFIDGISKTL